MKSVRIIIKFLKRRIIRHISDNTLRSFDNIL